MDIQTFLTTVGGVFSNEVTEGSSPASVALTADFPNSVGTEFLEIENDTNIDPGNNAVDNSYTITAFIYPTFLTAATNNRGIFSKGLNTDETTLQYQMLGNRTGVDLGQIIYQHSDGTSIYQVASGASSIANDTWHFIEITFDGTAGNLSIAIDRGTPVTTGSVLAMQVLVADLRVGGTTGTGIDSFEGQICLVGVWDRVLSSGELDEVYNSGLGSLFADLTTTNDALVYYQLDEASGTRAALGTESTATLQENATVPSSANVPS